MELEPEGQTPEAKLQLALVGSGARKLFEILGFMKRNSVEFTLGVSIVTFIRLACGPQ